jgi:hypothetical protein
MHTLSSSMPEGLPGVDRYWESPYQNLQDSGETFFHR